MNKFLILASLLFLSAGAHAACDEADAEKVALDIFALRTADPFKNAVEGRVERVNALPSLVVNLSRWYVAVSEDGNDGERYTFYLDENCQLERKGFRVLSESEDAD